MDKGGGVYLARVMSDGEVVAEQRLRRPDLPRCRRDERRPVRVLHDPPVPRQRHHDRDARHDPLGEDIHHDIGVEVLDAAGNVTSLAARRVGVDNQPPARGLLRSRDQALPESIVRHRGWRQLNGVGATPGARLRVYLPVTHSVRVKHGGRKGQRRRVTRAARQAHGLIRLQGDARALLSSAAGQPIGGAKVWTASRVKALDWQITGKPQTTSRTRKVALRLPARPLRARSTSSTSRSATATIKPSDDRCGSRFGAACALSVDRRNTHDGQRVRFAGGVEPQLPGRGRDGEPAGQAQQ